MYFEKNRYLESSVDVISNETSRVIRLSLYMEGSKRLVKSRNKRAFVLVEALLDDTVELYHFSFLEKRYVYIHIRGALIRRI